MSQPPPALASCPAGQVPGCWLQQSLLAIPTSHTLPGANAACQGPFLLRGCSASSVHFLQAGAEQRPPPALSGSEGGLGHSAGGFGEDGQDGSSLAGHLCCTGCCCPSCRAHPSPLLCSRRELSPQGPLVPKWRLSLVLGGRGTALRGSGSAHLPVLIEILLCIPWQQAGF